MRETITFVLNNRIERVSDLSGDATLLDWLRQRRRLTGSKEGCAEGDCGACTVVVARRDSATGAMRWHPVNACIQFMGMLEGTSVTTIEGTPGNWRVDDDEFAAVVLTTPAAAAGRRFSEYRAGIIRAAASVVPRSARTREFGL